VPNVEATSGLTSPFYDALFGHEGLLGAELQASIPYTSAQNRAKAAYVGYTAVSQVF
jgi:hypothetical protein